MERLRGLHHDEHSATIVAPIVALLGAVVVIGVLDLLFLALGEDLNRAIPALCLLVPVVAAGVLGGRLAALGATLLAAIAFAMLLPPFGSPAVDLGHDVAALVLFLVVGGASGVLMASVLMSERGRAIAELDRVSALERSARDRTALLRSVSHDLRSPLATVSAAATDLRSNDETPVPVRHEMLDLIIYEAGRLDRIVGNLLSLSRIEAGAFLPDRQATDVADLVEACVERLARVTTGVHLEVDAPADLPLVHVDYSQIDQVLANLVENAARHSPPDGRVLVAARVAAGRLELSVEDEGTGFAPEVRDRAFEPFATARPHGSSGIGLATSRAIAQAHGGDLRIDDRPVGARVVLEVPIDG